MKIIKFLFVLYRLYVYICYVLIDLLLLNNNIMKKVIDRMVYNTETAELVYEFSNGRGFSDYNFLREDLYLTKKGNWFLYYHGGAATKYSENSGQWSSDGRGIIPFSADEALEWLEKRDATEEIEKHFSNLLEEA
jgi:hypothetical protein